MKTVFALMLALCSFATFAVNPISEAVKKIEAEKGVSCKYEATSPKYYTGKVQTAKIESTALYTCKGKDQKFLVELDILHVPSITKVTVNSSAFSSAETVEETLKKIETERKVSCVETDESFPFCMNEICKSSLSYSCEGLNDLKVKFKITHNPEVVETRIK